VKTTPQGNSSHAPKDYSLWGSITKDYIVLHNGIHNNLQILFLQRFLFTYDTSTSLDPINKMKLNANYAQKLQFLPLTYLKERCGWIVNHIHLHLFPMYQTNHQMPSIIFHPPMDRFYIIGNLRFDQVYIFDLPLLPIRNSYLNYS
jgi:hypothetical protein